MYMRVCVCVCVCSVDPQMAAELDKIAEDIVKNFEQQMAQVCVCVCVCLLALGYLCS